MPHPSTTYSIFFGFWIIFSYAVIEVVLSVCVAISQFAQIHGSIFGHLVSDQTLQGNSPSRIEYCTYRSMSRWPDGCYVDEPLKIQFAHSSTNARSHKITWPTPYITPVRLRLSSRLGPHQDDGIDTCMDPLPGRKTSSHDLYRLWPFVAKVRILLANYVQIQD